MTNSTEADKNTTKTSAWLALVGSIIVLAGALAWGLQSVGGGIARRGGDTVSVRGTAQRNVKADRAVWKLSVSQSADTAAAAITGVNGGVELVIKFMKSNQVADDSIVPGLEDRDGMFAPANSKLCPKNTGPDFLRCVDQSEL